MPASKGYGTLDAQSPLAPYNFSRREPGPTEIVVDTLFCGVCHSDLHMVRNEWGGSVYPLVPGGFLLLEIGYGQSTAIADLLSRSGFAQIEFTPDLQGIPRVACARRP